MRSLHKLRFSAAFLLLGLAALLPASAATFTLTNDQVVATWKIDDQTLSPDSIQDVKTGQLLPIKSDLFDLVLTNGDYLRSTSFKLVGEVKLEPLPVNADAARLAEHLPGNRLVAELVSADGNLHVTWHALLRDGSRYVRQEYIFTPANAEIPLNGIMLLDTPMANARATGTVDGSPVVTATAFFAVEHPLSVNRGEMGYVRCFLPRGAALRIGESFACSSVVGFVDQGQLRRQFLAYLERERAHPYRPFLQYNSWYDIGYFNKYDEKAAVNAINSFGTELVQKRGVKMSSFLFDDGWDNNATLWQFDKTNFPNGFTPVNEAAAKYGAGPGIWLSPWGGYGEPHEERIKYGEEQGFEINNGNFSMSGPKYYQRFRQLCVDVIQKYGINQFKFDGIGAIGSDDDQGTVLRDFEAMLRLDDELRTIKPDLYINQTTGTWPSPFWLFHADSIWRGGEDHSFVPGNGPQRQRWITYKDNDVHDEVVGRSELYPLNSLMLHGIIFAQKADGLNYDTNNIFKSEVRAFFGNGTQLQEMYITPSLLSSENWDSLAEAANWSRKNADTLVDTHWIGGSPVDQEIYGWASWSPKKGILTIRNPNGWSGKISIDPAKAFELPNDAARSYSLVDPFKDQQFDVTNLTAGQKTTFKLKPYQVLVLEALPDSTKLTSSH
jgi:hypothetical protein